MWWWGAVVAGAVGVPLAGGSVRLLGRVRAAATWPDARRVRSGAGIAALAGVGTGVLLGAVAVGLACAGLTHPASTNGWLLPALGAFGTLLAGGSLAGRWAARAELTALIRTPPPTGGQAPDEVAPPEPSGHPAIPADGQPGWVYRDPDEGWYLAVREGADGWRLVRLPDFALVPADERPSLDLAGSVQLTVHPVADPAELAPLP